MVRKSSRPRKSAIPDDYMVDLQEMHNDIGDDDDPTSFKEAMESNHSSLWKAAVEDELASMERNKVWSLVDNDDRLKTIGSKWVSWWQRDLLKENEWIIMKHFLHRLPKTLLE